MPLLDTQGNDSADAYGGGVAATPNYIESCFSTYLYTGNGSTQSINNGIDLSTKGGMVWTKCRSNGQNNWVFDTARGANSPISTNTTDSAADAYATYFDPATNIVLGTTTGYSLAQTTGGTNTNNFTYVGWTFRKQPKFFDIVTWTGDGVSTGRQISHNLGSTPGFIVGKATSGSGFWRCFHRSLSTSDPGLKLNQTSAGGNSPYDYGDQSTVTAPTSTQFTAGINLNSNGTTYVAYLFAHNAGGFGLTGTDNVISCGSFTTDGSGEATVSVGYEPQWLLVKNTTSAEDWYVVDNMRGLVANGNATKFLNPNLSAAESTGDGLRINSTGFGASLTGSKTYIYIAIRRGPMAVPTDATKVFAPVTYTGNATARTLTTNFPVDLNTSFYRPGYSGNTYFFDRLRGQNQYLLSSNAGAEGSQPGFGFASNTGITVGTTAFNGSGETYINYMMSRAPSFFDEVCWTPNGSTNDRITHNLGVPPELIITKTRSPNSGDNWWTYSASLGRSSYLSLNTNAASGSITDVWGTSNPTSTDFGMKDTSFGFDSTYKEVAYLFATCPGVSKVGTYTGNGTSQAIACGFTGGARFVLIKRTDSTGDWYVYDTARGMTTLTDPYLLLDTTGAETATLGSVTTTTGGFTVNASILSAINTNAATYIFLAIA